MKMYQVIFVNFVFLRLSHQLNPGEQCFSKISVPSASTENLHELHVQDVQEVSKCAEVCTTYADCYSFHVLPNGPGSWKCTLLAGIAECNNGNVSTMIYYQADRLMPIERKIYLAEPTSEVVPPGNEIWPIDCNSLNCQRSAMIGLSEDPDETANLDQDIDDVICGSYGGNLMFDTVASEVVPIRDDVSLGHCPPGTVATAIWDDNLVGSSNFDTPDYLKCSPLVNGWKVNTDQCELFITKSEGLTITCSENPGIPNFVVAVYASPDDTDGIDEIKCCTLSYS